MTFAGPTFHDTFTLSTMTNDHEETTMTDDNDGPRLVSNSEVQAFKRCRRKWWLGHHRRLTLKRMGLTGPRQLGDRVHRALAAWYQPDGVERVDPRQALENVLNEDRAAAIEATRSSFEDGTITGAEGTDIDDFISAQLADFEKEADLARAMVEGYVEWLEETGADADLEVLSSESAVQVQLNRFENDVRLVGRLDVRVRRHSNDARLFLDHKTVGDLTSPVKQLSQNEQMLTYHVLDRANADAEGERCQGAIYNMLRKVKRTARAKPPFYGREEVRHNRHELNSFWWRLHGILRNMFEAESALEAGQNHLEVVYPTPTRDCSWDCDFAPVCPMFDDGSRAEDLLAVYYEERPAHERYADLMEETS